MVNFLSHLRRLFEGLTGALVMSRTQCEASTGQAGKQVRSNISNTAVVVCVCEVTVMGCGPSKEELECEARLGAPKSRDPLLRSPNVNGSSIRDKREAVNDLTLSQTQHVHELGTMTIIESPFDLIDASVLDDLFLLDTCQAREDSLVLDLGDVDAVVREMLLPGWEQQGEGDGEGCDESVSCLSSLFVQFCVCF